MSKELFQKFAEDIHLANFASTHGFRFSEFHYNEKTRQQEYVFKKDGYEVMIGLISDGASGQQHIKQNSISGTTGRWRFTDMETMQTGSIRDFLTRYVSNSFENADEKAAMYLRYYQSKEKDLIPGPVPNQMDKHKLGQEIDLPSFVQAHGWKANGSSGDRSYYKKESDLVVIPQKSGAWIYFDRSGRAKNILDFTQEKLALERPLNIAKAAAYLRSYIDGKPNYNFLHGGNQTNLYKSLQDEIALQSKQILSSSPIRNHDLLEKAIASTTSRVLQTLEMPAVESDRERVTGQIREYVKGNITSGEPVNSKVIAGKLGLAHLSPVQFEIKTESLAHNLRDTKAEFQNLEYYLLGNRSFVRHELDLKFPEHKKLNLVRMAYDLGWALDSHDPNRQQFNMSKDQNQVLIYLTSSNQWAFEGGGKKGDTVDFIHQYNQTNGQASIPFLMSYAASIQGKESPLAATSTISRVSEQFLEAAVKKAFEFIRAKVDTEKSDPLSFTVELKVREQLQKQMLLKERISSTDLAKFVDAVSGRKIVFKDKFNLHTMEIKNQDGSAYLEINSHGAPSGLGVKDPGLIFRSELYDETKSLRTKPETVYASQTTQFTKLDKGHFQAVR